MKSDFYTLYSLNELFALVVSMIIGTAAYISFISRKNEQNMKIGTIIKTGFINLFVTYIASEILKIKKLDLGDYRSAVLPIVAFMGIYIVTWFDKRYPKLFDAGAKKIGIDLDEKKEEIEENDDIIIEENQLTDECIIGIINENILNKNYVLNFEDSLFIVPSKREIDLEDVITEELVDKMIRFEKAFCQMVINNIIKNKDTLETYKKESIEKLRRHNIIDENGQIQFEAAPDKKIKLKM